MSNAEQDINSLSEEFQLLFFQKLEKDEQIRVNSEWSFSEYTKYARDWVLLDIRDFGKKCYGIGFSATTSNVNIHKGLANLQRLLSMRYQVGVHGGHWSLYDESEDCVHSADGYMQFFADLAELDNTDFIDIWIRQTERQKRLAKGDCGGT